MPNPGGPAPLSARPSVSADFPLPTGAAVRALGASLVGPDLVVYPVRHHSPACAWQLRRLIAERPPSAVLIEGPRSFTPLVPLLAHPEARMPLAVYAYAAWAARGELPERRRAAYYPFCDYSPELVALRAAVASGIPVRFIDLDHAEQAAHDDARARADEDVSLLAEHHLRRSDYLQSLARSLGCRDHEELWEHLFEVDVAACATAEHVARVATYCHLARIDTPHAVLAADGTLAREAEMAFHIRAALDERAADAGPVLAVLGGFHAVVMPALLASPPPRPVPPGDAPTESGTALIRYGFERLDRLNGYGAGMTSPAWHQRVWDGMTRHERAGLDVSRRVRDEAALASLADVAQTLRGAGVAVPMPALAGAYEQLRRLADLRNRPAPVRDDVVDAVTSSFVKGDADADGAFVLATLRRALCGDAVGKVPPGAGTPPLVKDFEQRARRARLRIDDTEPRRAVLEIYRRPGHRVTSRLFHGLVLLGVPFAMRTAGPDFVNGTGLERLQEHWEYRHGPATEAALVEAAVWGATVPLAVANRFADRVDRLQADGAAADARAAARLLVHGCVLGLHEHLPRVIDTVRAAIAADAAFDSVAGAAGALGLLRQSREPLEARSLALLPAVLKAAYERAIYLGGAQGAGAGDGEPIVQALVGLRELLGSAAGEELDPTLYWALAGDLATAHPMPLVRGGATGLLYGTGRIDDVALARAVDGHLDGLVAAGDAVAFLRGLLSTAREAAWQQPALLRVLDGLLDRWDEASFVQLLPQLRLAFAEMTPMETDRIAEAVTGLHGGAALGHLVRADVGAHEVQANLALSATVKALLAADGLDAWTTAP